MMDQETSSGTSSSGTDSDDDDLPFGGPPAVYCTNCTSRLVLGTVCMVSCAELHALPDNLKRACSCWLCRLSEGRCHSPLWKAMARTWCLAYSHGLGLSGCLRF